MLKDIPTVTIEFSSEFELETIPVLGAYSVSDALNGIKHLHSTFATKVLELAQRGYLFGIVVNESQLQRELEDITLFDLQENNYLKIIAYPQGAGNTLTNIALGVGFLALGLSGVGLLGISATSFALMGASLLFSSIFKHPKTDTKQRNDKRSVNFTGVVNVTGGGGVAPLVFGEMAIGSIVVSGEIVPYETSV